MSFSKQNVVVAAISMALSLLLLTSHPAAGADAITPLNTCETPIPWALCFGKTYICIPLCVGMHYTGGFCQQQQQLGESIDAEAAGFGGAICVCTKQCLAEAEAAAGGRPSRPPVQPPMGMRGVGMLN